MKAKFTFLGTGASLGVPVIGCDCSTCVSKDQKNKRLRSAGLIQCKGKNFLIDAGPDVRTQLINQQISSLDGLFLTHSHYDHIGGLDELRVFSFKNKKPIDCILSKNTRREIEKRYYYMFEKPTGDKSYFSRFCFQQLESEKMQFFDIPIQPVYYFQGGMEVTGFIIGDFAYLCDIKNFDEEIFKQLKGVNTLVISALQKQNSLMHLNLNEAVQFARKIKSKKSYFTHISHLMSHQEGSKDLPKDIELGFDGLSFTFNIEYDK